MRLRLRMRCGDGVCYRRIVGVSGDGRRARSSSGWMRYACMAFCACESRPGSSPMSKVRDVDTILGGHLPLPVTMLGHRPLTRICGVVWSLSFLSAEKSRLVRPRPWVMGP